MSQPKYEIPKLMHHRVLQLGDSGEQWIEALDALLVSISEDWQLRIGDQISGATEALVFSVKHTDQPAILKIGIPGSLGPEALTLKLAAGVGYANYLKFDASNDALLLEQLGGQLAAASLPVTEQIKVICATLKLAWKKITDSAGLNTGAELARRQELFIRENWDALGRPCSVRLIDEALEFIQHRKIAFDPDNSYLLHGDAHVWNTLEARDSPTGYKFVDPDGIFGEPALDLAISLREWREELLATDALVVGQHRCELLSDLSGISQTAIWEWGLIEHTSCGLLDLKLGDPKAALDHFSIAERWLEA